MPSWIKAAWTRFDPWRGQRLPLFVLLILFVLRFGDPAVLETARLQSFDFFQKSGPAAAATTEVVVVDIDDQSLAALGQWPWPRNRMASLLDVIAAQNPKVVGFDILFAESDQHSPENFTADHPDLPESLRSALVRLPPHDRLFAQSLARAPSVLGVVAGFGNGGPVEDGKSTAQTTVIEIGGKAGAYLQKSQTLLRNLATLEDASRGIGVINLAFDPDGVIRRIPLVVQADGRLIPTLAMELLAVAATSRTLSLHVGAAGIEGAEVDGHFVPTDRLGRVWVRFAQPNSFRRFSASNVLSGNIAADQIEGKIVLLGTTAAGIADYVATPIGSAMPSLLIHANLLSTLLNETALARPPITFFIELFVVILASLLLMVTQRRYKVRATVALFLLLLWTIPLASWLVFLLFDSLFDPSFPLLAVALVFPAVITASLVNEERRRREATRQAERQEREKEARIRTLQAELLRTSRANSIGHFSSALSHELNQPLAAVYNFLQAARNLARKGQGAADKLDGMLEKALAQTQRGSSILKGMREIVEHGEVSATGTDINLLVEETLDLCRVPGHLENTALGVTLSPGLPLVLANRVQIHQVLTNLIQNASEAMQRGGELSLATAPDGAGHVRVTVSDRGPGLSVEAEANLFKPFNTTKATGMGLGLSICRAIIEAHGGRLWAQPRNGGGTTFAFTLPTAGNPAGAVKPDSMAPA